jgi:hypothetical protein
LSALIADCDAQTWDRQIDADFPEDGRLRTVLDEVRTDLRAGRLDEARPQGDSPRNETQATHL